MPAKMSSSLSVTLGASTFSFCVRGSAFYHHPVGGASCPAICSGAQAGRKPTTSSASGRKTTVDRHHSL